MNVRVALYAWRDSEAKAKNIEGFRVFPNATLDAIVTQLPRNKEELLQVKGIKEAKYKLYGKAILNIIAESIGSAKAPEQDPQAFVSLSGVFSGSTTPPERPAYSISQFLDILNRELYRITARVRGEVVSVQERGSALYFSVKDTESDAVLSVFMWSSDYRLSGVDLSPGLEIIIEGKAEIYKPMGRLSLRAQSLELVGEGMLKKAYDALYKKLELEGLFSADRKRELKKLPVRIGVITSKHGAVIHDFLNNLGKFGFQIKFLDARVEGVLAVKDIYRAIATMKNEDIDALVLIRGGGSLESLQAFNNEHIVRALAAFPVPVICAIGHDKDVPLAQLVADYAPSTPTACTTLLNESWSAAGHAVESYKQQMFASFGAHLRQHELQLVRAQHYFEKSFSDIRDSITDAIDGVVRLVPRFQYILQNKRSEVESHRRDALMRLKRGMEQIRERLSQYATLLTLHDPMRQLQLGYSILRSGASVLRSVSDLKQDDTIEGQLSDGAFEARVTTIKQYDEKNPTT